jgi:uncharacterized membrane protein YhaH (DUF805 family)
MESFAAIVSASGRIARKPFWIGVIAVYAASFLTQFLLAAPVTARAGVVPFVLVQAAIAWAWFVLHARRLRDAGRPVGLAVALSVLYVLAIVLLLLVMVAATAPGSSTTVAPAVDQPPSPSIFDLFLVLFLLGLAFGDPSLGMFGYILLGVIALILLPILIAVAFTIWVGTRPGAPAAPAP